MSRHLPIARSTLSSPVWFVPFDEFDGRVRAAGVGVRLDRFADGRWLELDEVAVRTPSAALAYPGLGRRGEPWTARPQLHRARFTAAGRLPLYPADGEPFSADLAAVEFLVHPYNDAFPPEQTVAPRLLRLLPAVSFPYPPGVRTVHGVVLRAGAPVAGALVEARGLTGRDRAAWHERTLTDAAGAFRLALRWEGERAGADPAVETFRLHAAERPGRDGTLTVRLPEEADRRHVIEIRES